MVEPVNRAGLSSSSLQQFFPTLLSIASFYRFFLPFLSSRSFSHCAEDTLDDARM